MFRSDRRPGSRPDLPLRPAAGAAVVAVVATAAGLVGCASPPSPSEGAAGVPVSGATLARCAELADGFRHADTRIVAATPVAAGTQVTIDGVTHTLPAYCHVQGRMHERVSPVDGQAYAIRWEMRLPQDWNGRLFFQPNGGNEGSLAMPAVQAFGRTLGGGPLTTGLGRGFAVVTTDSGHDGSANQSVAPGIRGQVFGRDPEARTDNAHAYVARVTPMAKALVAAAYGKPPARSYMVGCSNGGRIGMITATRYPELFDGIVAGAPAFNLPKAVVGAIWNGQQLAAVAPSVDGRPDLSASFTQADMDLVAARVTERCDALDGLADGAVHDVAACKAAFSLERDVPTCGASKVDGQCLSAAQKAALGRIMAGAVDSAGRRLYADWPYDPGMRTAGWRNWLMGATRNANGPASASNPTSFILTLTGPSMAFMFTNPPQSPAVVTGTGTSLYDYMAGYSMDTDAPKIFGTGNGFRESPYAEYTPPDPTRLDAFARRGGKLLVFHGNADPVFSLSDLIEWHAGVLRRAPDADRFARVFTVPGMNHCSGGPAADRFDAVGAVVDWVEQGRAPERLVATARTPDQNNGLGAVPPGRTRPLCPWPKVARYDGGDPEREASFSCR